MTLRWEAPTDALAIDEPAGGKLRTSHDPSDDGRPWVSRSLMAGGLMRSPLIRSWPRWSIWSSVMGWGSWMMIS